jgi:hypothetical protein
MTRRADEQAVQTSCYEEMPLALVLFRYLWPFWLFKDASRGDRYARAAAYRHNRDMRVYLPGYMAKWVCNSVLAFALVAASDSVSLPSGSWDVFTLLTATAAIAFAGSLIVLFITGYVYVYLDRHER